MPAAVRAAGVLAGRVVSGRAPLGTVRVYAYQVAELTLTRATTDRLGEFQFKALPAGLYKVIAHKPGFVPAVVLVARATADLFQYLDVELAHDQPAGAGAEDDFWTVRSRIPADVLREIQYDEARLLLHQPDDRAVVAEMTAESGVADWFGQSADVAGAALDLQAALGDVRFALQGDFQRLARSSLDGVGAGGSLSKRERLEIAVRHADSSQVVLSGLSSQWLSSQWLPGNAPHHEGVPGLSSLTRYGLLWTQRVGSGRSSFSAGWVDETHFGDQRLAAFGLPQASTALGVEGSYAATFSPNASLQSGVRYRSVEARDSGLPYHATLAGMAFADSGFPAGPNAPSSPPADGWGGRALSERLDLYSFGDYRVQPAILVQFGLYTTLADGSLAFNPRAGLVVDLGSWWQLETMVQERLQQGVPDELFPYLTTLYEGTNLECGAAEQSCYRVKLERRVEDEQRFSATLIEREFAEPLRLHLGSDDPFARHETLLLVPGDHLPELQVSFSRRISPGVLASFASTVAAGGGGTLASRGAAVRNRVGYLVTSLGTNIEPSDTELQLAYHQLEQRLVADAPGRAPAVRPDLDLDRLQLVVVQGLPFGFASEWAVSLDVQLSRGRYPWSQPSDDPDEIRKQVIGGIAVRF